MYSLNVTADKHYIINTMYNYGLAYGHSQKYIIPFLQRLSKAYINTIVSIVLILKIFPDEASHDFIDKQRYLLNAGELWLEFHYRTLIKYGI